MTGTLDRFRSGMIEALTMAAIAVGMLLFGGAYGVSFAISFALLATAFVLWAVERVFAPFAADGDTNALPVRSHFVWIAPLALAVWLIAQTIPLPMSVVGSLSPVRAEKATLVTEAFPELATEAIPIATDATLSRRALVLPAACLMAFVLGLYASTDRSRAQRFIRFLLLIAILEAVYALLEALSGQHSVLWFPALKEGDATGTLINRTHFAALLNLLLPISVGWFYFRMGEGLTQKGNSALLPPTHWDVLGSRQGLSVLTPGLLIVAIVQSHSRAGFAVMILTTTLFFFIGSRRQSARGMSGIGAALAVCLLAYGVISDHQGVRDRFDESPEIGHHRLTAWSETAAMVSDYTLTGAGFANYELVYPPYKSEASRGYRDHACSDWLEGVSTIGVIGMTPVALGVLTLLLAILIRLRSTGPDFPWVMGAWCGLIGYAFHCATEGVVRLPALSLMAALVAGLTLGVTAAADRPRQATRRDQPASPRWN